MHQKHWRPCQNIDSRELVPELLIQWVWGGAPRIHVSNRFPGGAASPDGPRAPHFEYCCCAVSRLVPPYPPPPDRQHHSQLATEKTEVLTGRVTLLNHGEVNCMGCPALLCEGSMPGGTAPLGFCQPTLRPGRAQGEGTGLASAEHWDVALLTWEQFSGCFKCFRSTFTSI